MNGIKENITRLRAEVPDEITIVAVSKTRSVQEINEAYNAGHRDFGENKVQELLQKSPLLPPDTQWHFIGHLQRNKVKSVVPVVHLIHSLDSISLMEEINKEANKISRTIDCLLQFHIASEETKYGLNFQEAVQLIENKQRNNLVNISIAGVMGMASFTEDTELIRHEFHQLKKIFQLLKSDFFYNDLNFRNISMGMSGDYHIAVSEGSTIIRVGTAIFGDRIYPVK